MKYTGITYRPPFEANSLLLQVTQGCSHNHCSFCTMYRDTPFRVESIEQIEQDLKEATAYSDHIDRVFLENGDPFALHAEQLSVIAECIHRYLPKVKTISMYASINNIRGKTDAELVDLRKLGINELNIGVESGLNDALQIMNKGYTSKEAMYELLRLTNAGIDYGANVIFGCAGAGRGIENAIVTAELLNRTKPYLIFTGTIHADKGCPLYEDIHNGSFAEETFAEYLDEEQELLELLDLDGVMYFGAHPSNVAPMVGTLNRDKEKLIAELDRKRKELGTLLNTVPRRGGEGAIIC